MNNKSIKEELVGAGFKQEYVDSLKPAILKNLHTGFKTGSVLPPTITPIASQPLIIIPQPAPAVEENKPPLFDPKNPPKPTDPNWTAYAMSLFENDELEGQNPRLEGLRRITEKLIGRIVSEESHIYQSPSNENGMCAVVKSTIKIINKDCPASLLQYPHNAFMIFEGCADATPSNCMGDFANYLTAMAETRSKGRAYRSILKLKRVISAEEAAFIGETEDINAQSIKSGQITMITVMCDRLQVSANKLMKYMEIEKATVKDLTTQEGISILNQLNLFQNNDKIPESLKRG